MFQLLVFAVYLVFNTLIAPHGKNIEDRCEDFKLSGVIKLNDEAEPVTGTKLFIDDEHNFIFTDSPAHKVKIFDETGEPVYIFGRYGRGPGDFEYPTASLKKKNIIYTITFGGKLTVWDFDSREIHHIAKLPLLGVNNIKLINDSLMVMNGIRLDASRIVDKKRMHLVDLNEYKIVTSFFAEPVDYLAYSGIANAIGDILNFDVLQDRIVVSYGVSTKIYAYKFDQNNVHLDFVQNLEISDYFDSILDYDITDLLDVRTFGSKFSTVQRIFYLNNGNLVVQVRKYDSTDSSGNYSGAQYYHFYHDTDSQNTCFISINGNLSDTYGEYLYVVSVYDHTKITKYKIGDTNE